MAHGHMSDLNDFISINTKKTKTVQNIYPRFELTSIIGYKMDISTFRFPLRKFVHSYN